jgi:hypothetical protein
VLVSSLTPPPACQQISNVTDNNGIARFHLILATGIPGNYSLRFRSVGGSAVVSDSTATFRVPRFPHPYVSLRVSPRLRPNNRSSTSWSAWTW